MRLSLVVVVPAVVLCSFAVAQPSIDAGGVLNVSSAEPVLAPDTVFVIYGKNLGPASIVTSTAPNYPPMLAGVSVSFTPANSGPVLARMVYVLSNAIVGVFPSGATPGTYDARVTVDGVTSAPQSIAVVARHFGIAAANGVGSGIAQATIANVNGGYSLTRFTSNGTPGGTTFINAPAHGNDVISLWGTGGGPDLANDTGGSSGDQTAIGNFKVLVGNRQITPGYAAAVAGYPGLWVVNFTLPADITPDCFATVQVSAGGEIGNAVTLPIAPAGQPACVDSSLTPAALTKLDAGGAVVAGGFSVSKLIVTNTFVTSGLGQTIDQLTNIETITGAFGRYSAAEYATRFGQHVSAPCTTYESSGTPSTLGAAATPDSYVNAGLLLPVGGPGLAANAVLTGGQGGIFMPPYSLTLPTGTLAGGTYTLTGSGGPDMGPFSASLTFPDSFNVSNWEFISIINRNGPFSVSWTGGGTESVIITLSGQTTLSGNPQIPATQLLHRVTLVCIAPASAGTFTIPASSLVLLPVTSRDATTGSVGYLTVQAVSNPTSGHFTANLTSGGPLDFGDWTYSLGVSRNVALN